MKNLTDTEIIDSIKKGNHSDFSLLVDMYKGKAFSMLKRMLRNENDAEEVLQDCFLKAFYGLNGFKNEAKFSTWFYRIVYNTALTKLAGKKRKIENEMSSLEDHFDLKSEYDHEITERDDLQNYIHGMIEQLPPKHAAVISMFYLEDMSCEEIGSILGATESNVKVMLHRSRNSLKEMMLQSRNLKEIM
ncbi:MAG: RNA polymerase sigma factor [Methanococcaceae archaeon]